MMLYKMLSDFTLALYFFTDHPLYFHKVGLWQYSPSFMKNCDYINNVFWLLSSLFDMAVGVAEINHLHREIAKVSK